MNLTELYACNNPITSLPQTVSGWVSLRELAMRGTKLKELPRCVVSDVLRPALYSLAVGRL